MIQVDSFLQSDNVSQEFIRKAMDDIMKRNPKDFQQPPLVIDYGRYLILTNLPKVKEEMIPKLTQALKGFMQKKNLITPLQINVSNNGEAFISYETEQQAQEAYSQLNLINFDLKHQLHAYTTKKLEAIQTTGEYKPLSLKTTAELLDFTQNPMPQILMVQNQTKMTVQWFQPQERKLEDCLTKTLEKYKRMFWSPRGTYLVLIDGNSFSLHGGQQMELMHTYEHEKVKDILFSPDEAYLISYNDVSTTADVINYLKQNFEVWNVRSEIKLRTFSKNANDEISSFQFSPDGKYLARLGKDEVTLYQSPDFFQWENPIALKGVQEIKWINKNNTLVVACYPKEGEQNTKSQILFYQVPDKSQLRWRNMTFEVDSIQLFPHHFGRWIGTLIKKKKKNKVSSSTLQLGNLQKTDPFEIDEHTFEEDVENVFFEQFSGKFAINYRERDKQQKQTQFYSYHIFSVQDENKKSISLIPLGVLKEKETNELLWATNGNYFCLINKLKDSPDQGKVEFGFIQKSSQTVEITKSTNHFYMSHAQWDPTGIYFVTMSDKWHSVIIWSSIGELLVKDSITKINEIIWRNKPIHILPLAKEQKLLQDSKVFSKQYELEDDKVQNKTKYEKEQKRKEMKEQFSALLQQKNKQYTDSKQKRIQLLGFDENDESELVTQEIILREEQIE